LTDFRQAVFDSTIGALLHFCVLCAALFFLGSVFNVTVAVVTFTTDSIVKRHARAVLVIECVVAVVVPGSLVGYTTTGTSGYTDDMYWGDFSTYTCSFGDGMTHFFTFVLPLQIICASTTIMVVLMIRRMKQSVSLRISLLSSQDRASIAQIALMKRFIVIAIVIPFSSVIAFTACSFVALPSVNDRLLEDIYHYSVCLTDPRENNEGCSFTALMTGYALCNTFEPIVFAVVSVLLMIYSLAPTPAKQFWMSKFKRLNQLFCGYRNKSGEETVSKE
jgi:hypothetical protein